MNNSKAQYLPIKDAAIQIGKSESSIRRIVLQIKTKSPKKYKDAKYFKFENLSTGHQKVYVSNQFVQEYFNCSFNYSTNNSTEQLNESSSAIYLKTIEILERELENKNKQIDELLERQRESNILLLGNKQVLQLEEKPKRWWQRKK